VGKGDVIIKHASLFSFKNYSLVTSLGETYYCATLWSWLVGDTCFSRVVLGEGTSDKGNHFLNKMFKIGPKYQLFALVLIETGLFVAFF
jgi:hypothetical protein